MATIDENEMTGYQYRDVVAPAKYNPFKYLSQNPDTKFAVMEAVEVNVKFEFFDMKYLSQTIQFSQTLKSADLLAGNVEGALDIYFKQLEESDANTGSKYVVGGRTYFEATVFGVGIQSFTTKGFFDKKDYVEPTANNLKGNKVLLSLTIVGCIAGAIALVLLVYCCYCKRSTHQDTDKTHVE